VLRRIAEWRSFGEDIFQMVKLQFSHVLADSYEQNMTLFVIIHGIHAGDKHMMEVFEIL
jgi:hypothetical protein